MHWDGEGHGGPRIAPSGRGSRAPGLGGSQRPAVEPVSLASVRALRGQRGPTDAAVAEPRIRRAPQSRRSSDQRRDFATRWLESRIHAAQQELAVSDIATAMGVCGLVVFSLLYLVTLSAPVAVAGGVGSFGLPILWLERCRADLRRRFLDELPHAVATLAVLVRSGRTLRQAFLRVGADASEPVASAFLDVARQPEREFARVAGRRLLERYPGEHVELLAAALSVHAQTGVALPELLDRVVEALRSRERARPQERRKLGGTNLDGPLVAVAAGGTACLMLLASVLPAGFDRQAWLAMVVVCSLLAALLSRHVGRSDA